MSVMPDIKLISSYEKCCPQQGDQGGSPLAAVGVFTNRNMRNENFIFNLKQNIYNRMNKYYNVLPVIIFSLTGCNAYSQSASGKEKEIVFVSGKPAYIV